MMSVTIENVNESFVEKIRLVAKEMGQDILINFNDKNQKTLNEPKIIENTQHIDNEPKTLAGVLLSIPKLDLEDDFFNSCKK